MIPRSINENHGRMELMASACQSAIACICINETLLYLQHLMIKRAESYRKLMLAEIYRISSTIGYDLGGSIGFIPQVRGKFDAKRQRRALSG